VNICLVPSSIASVAADSFSEQLLNCGDERVERRERKLRERNVGCLQAAGQRRGVVALW